MPKQSKICCFRCGCKMTDKIFDGNVIQFCDNCGSVWLNHDVLEKISDVVQFYHKNVKRSTTITSDLIFTYIGFCPNCSSKMNTEIINDIEVDICSKCGGTFLDQNELIKFFQKQTFWQKLKRFFKIS